MAAHVSQATMDRQIGLMRQADADEELDIRVRHGLVALSSVALAVATSALIFAIWGLGYVLIDLAYTRLLKRTGAPVSRARFLAVVAMSALVAAWFSLMAVYLAGTDGGKLFFLGAGIVMAVALRCLSSHAALGVGAWIDYASVVLPGVGVTVVAMTYASSPMTALAFAVGGLSLVFYFTHSFLRLVAERGRMRATLEQEGRDAKLAALGQLTSGVAHDFNNLLTAIGGNIELAKLTGDKAARDEMLDEALASSRHGASLVTQLLDYTGRSPLSASAIHPNEALSRVSNMSRRVLPANIDLVLSTAPVDDVLWADPGKLDAALLNLIVNARDAIGPSRGSISLSYRIEPGRQSISFMVRDSGPGMSDEVLRRSTEPFFTTKDVGSGSGLGLSMVKGFAEQTGGALRLVNLGDEGFEAIVTLPLGRAA